MSGGPTRLHPGPLRLRRDGIAEDRPKRVDGGLILLRVVELVRGFEARSNSPDEMAGFLDRDYVKFRDLIQKLGLQVE